jgi:glycosyltransferase involved in cell wall biosynthesis
MKLNPLKLLFVMRDAIPPFRPDARVIFGIELAKRGVTSDLVGPVSERSADDATWPAGRLAFTGKAGGMVAEALKPWRDLKAITHLGGDHDVILVRDRTFSGLVAWAIARWRGKPFAFWMSFPMVEGYEGRARSVGKSKGRLTWWANSLRAWLSRRSYYGFIAPRADHIFVQSDAMLEFMRRQGIPADKMTAVPMGVDIQRLNIDAVVPSTDPRLDGKRVVVYLGDLGLARQPGFLLDVADQLRQRHPDLLLVLAGDAGAEDERAWLRSRVKELNLDPSIWITGWLPQTEALKLVRRAEVGLSPIPRGPLYDVSSPTKALEYIAMGVPCVGNDIPDQAYVLQRSGAGICAPMEVAQFCDAIDQLLKNPERAKQMGALGPEFVKKERSYEVISQRVFEVLQRLHQQPGR